MQAEDFCAECGRELPPDAPERLCPACLMRSALWDWAENEGAAADEGNMDNQPTSAEDRALHTLRSPRPRR